MSQAPTMCSSCGRRYAAAEWHKLELVGIIDDRDEPEGELLEQRNCTCSSTITRVLHARRRGLAPVGR